MCVLINISVFKAELLYVSAQVLSTKVIYHSDLNHIHNKYFRLIFGLVNTIHTYFKVKTCVVWREFLALNEY
jgi:hypothetical protein